MNIQEKPCIANAGSAIEKATTNQRLFNQHFLYGADNIATTAKELASKYGITFDQAMLVITEDRESKMAGHTFPKVDDTDEEPLVINLDPEKEIISNNQAYRDNLKLKSLASNNSSGYTGVSWFKPSCKWRAQIRTNNKTMHLGLHEQLFDAVCARKSAEYKYGYHI